MGQRHLRHPHITGQSAADLIRALQEAPMVACDEVVWSLFGISMAGWNGIASLGLVALLVVAMSLRPRPA